MIVRDKRYTTTVVRGAFTLMEVLVVVAILVMLAGVGIYSYTKILEDGKKSAAILQIKTLTDAVGTYYIKHGEYPPSLATLTERDADGGKAYLQIDALQTPWKSTYQYDASGPNNGGSQPDIWADSPVHGRIGNWPQQK